MLLIAGRTGVGVGLEAEKTGSAEAERPSDVLSGRVETVKTSALSRR